MVFLFDTNCVLAYLRKNKLSHQIDKQFAPFSADNIPTLSAVSVGELKSIALQRQWSMGKVEELNEFLKLFRIFDINYSTILQRYAEIDAFSQDKLPNKSLGISSRNMGKNDLWIAATASIVEANLLTTDKDFNHLHNQFLEVIWLDPDRYK